MARALTIYEHILKHLEGTPALQAELPLYVKVGHLALKQADVAKAVAMYDRALPPEASLGSQDFPTAEALGRIPAVDIRAPHALPPFPRSSVGGYAVRAADTFGASASLPAYLSVAGEVLMGTLTTLSLDRGQAALVHTGGMIPAGADAV